MCFKLENKWIYSGLVKCLFYIHIWILNVNEYIYLRYVWHLNSSFRLQPVLCTVNMKKNNHYSLEAGTRKIFFFQKVCCHYSLFWMHSKFLRVHCSEIGCCTGINSLLSITLLLIAVPSLSREVISTLAWSG